MGKLEKEPAMAVYRPGDATEDGPPAYTSAAGSQLDVPPYEGRKSSSSSLDEVLPHKPGKIPGAINAYWPNKMSRKFHLGEHNDKPLFAGKVSSGWSRSKPELTIFDGPDSGTCPMLAAITRVSMFGGKKYDISLPPLPGSGSSEHTKELLTTSSAWSAHVFQFSIEVQGVDSQLKREDFEWRSTRGEEVRGLGSKWTRGWKLVRMSSEAFRGPGGERHERDEGTTSDGKEIVAVWAHNSSWSMTKAFKFRFQGSALAGVLGERFDIMALATAVHMWHQELAANAASSSAAAA